jgi:hypothetical protein
MSVHLRRPSRQAGVLPIPDGGSEESTLLANTGKYTPVEIPLGGFRGELVLLSMQRLEQVAVGDALTAAHNLAAALGEGHVDAERVVALVGVGAKYKALPPWRGSDGTKTTGSNCERRPDPLGGTVSLFHNIPQPSRRCRVLASWLPKCKFGEDLPNLVLTIRSDYL